MTRNFPFWTVQPSLSPLRFLQGVRSLRDNSLPAQFGSVLKHPLTVAGKVFGINDRVADVVYAEKIGEHLLALDVREFAKVAIPPKKIRRNRSAYPPASSACSSEKFDRPSWNIQGVGNDGKLLRPVQPVAGVDLLSFPRLCGSIRGSHRT
jgi:hypothetical protein